jgi:hypothetical protein
VAPSPAEARGQLAPFVAGSETSREGALAVHDRLSDLQSAVCGALHAAGPVRRQADGTVTGGLTIQEIAAAVSRRLGRLVKETTICGRLGELTGREAGRRRWVVDSGCKRMGNAGVRCQVWVHVLHANAAAPDNGVAA